MGLLQVGALDFSTSLQGVGPSMTQDLMHMPEAADTLPGDTAALESDSVLLGAGS